ncbi:MAG: N-acetylmuramoyl-L-alanine amidase [Symploca sp. SIO2E9]|nr:N-acetylmuramoyl-L-alanine amidase [Symploca sp. SIO2E9]
MKLKWLFLLTSFWSFFLLSGAAEAARLLSWRFDASQNRLVFTTDSGIQPKAQLLANPTRLVVDLPGTTLGGPRLNQQGRGAIREVRVGQFDNRTTRIVVELAPGYFLDPQKVQFQGLSPSQWSVQLPRPEPIVSSSSPRSRQREIPANDSSSSPPHSSNAQSLEANLPSNLSVTRDGFFIRIPGAEPGFIKVRENRPSRRRRDRGKPHTVDVEVENLILPSSLANREFALNSHGVSQIQFLQEQTDAKTVALIRLNVTGDSNNWRASFSSVGGLVILPEKANAASRGSSRQNSSGDSNSRLATIGSVQLANNGTQLLIRANRNIKAISTWDISANAFRITIPSAQLAEQVKGPNLDASSPVSRVKLRQQDESTVVILVEPGNGIQIGSLNQLNDQLLALQLLKTGSARPPTGSIRVPPPARRIPSARSTRPRIPSPRSRVPNSRIVVMLDPGHGGKDPGAVGIGGLQEKDVILPISRRVEQILEQNGIQVVLTRSSDYFVSLSGRVQMAERANADLFVSIHANAINLSRPDVNGLETYYYQTGRSLAQTIHNNVLRRINMRNRGVRQARFYVLRRTSMPAALVEVGFVTGREDFQRLANPTFQNQMAEAIAEGILQYVRRRR